MPDGISRSTNFVPFDVHGVAGVVPALIARDDVEARREQVDDLALAFVAPLRAEHCEIHDRATILLSNTRDACIDRGGRSRVAIANDADARRSQVKNIFIFD